MPNNRKAAEDAARAKEEEARAKTEAEEKAKAEKAEGKRAKDAAKNAAKKNKRILKGAVKDANYFYGAGDATPSVIDHVLSDVELVIAKIDNEELAALAAKLNGKKDASDVKSVYVEEVKRLQSGGKLKAGDIKTLLS